MKYFIIPFLLFVLISCSSHQEKPLKIAVNSWIGFSPLFYAHEKGYLKDLDIQIIPTISLAESLSLYSVKKVDILAATQHEYNSLKKDFTTLTPFILIDRSNGADMILSNRKIQTLKNAKTITAYLEIDSINLEMIESFIHKNNLNQKKINFINKDQLQIQTIKNDTAKAILLATYSPYDITLLKKGFFEVASTKETKKLLVVDALVATKELILQHKQQLLQVKKILNRSIEEIKKNPKKSFRLIKKYLNNISFQNFQDSLKMIEWLNHPSEQFLQKLKTINYKKSQLL